MKRKALFVLIILLVALFAVSVTSAGAKKACTSISSGQLYTPSGKAVLEGTDKDGYNYQAHQAKHYYDFGANGLTFRVLMKWNEAYLSNADCDGNYKLDQHYGFSDYTGSGAWITFHYNGEYVEDGMTCEWTKFIKVIAVPDGAYKEGGVYYTADGEEIGPASSLVGYFGFATIQLVVNDPCNGLQGQQFGSPDHTGFGGW